MGEYKENPPIIQSDVSDKKPEIQRYLGLIDEADKLAARYKGTEKEYLKLIELLSEAEDIVGRQSDIQGDTPIEKEQSAAKIFQTGKNILTISSLLEKAQEKQNEYIHGALSQEKPPQTAVEKETVFVLKKIPSTILPPGDIAVTPSGEGGKYEPVRFEQRLQELLKILLEHEVFIDDIIVTIGETGRQQRREVSYASIEIPRLRRVVLVCDQVGEATFVIHGYISPEELSSLTKEQLQTKYVGKVKKIDRHNEQQWRRELQEAIFTEDSWGKLDTSEQPGQSSVKLDTRDIDAWRTILHNQYTPQQWVNLESKQKRKMRINGLGLLPIARIFGVQGNLVDNRAVHLELGRQIYGDDAAILMAAEENRQKKEAQKRPIEQWREIIKGIYTAEQWVELKEEEKLKLKIDGLKLIAIAKIFGIHKNPISRHETHLNLGKQIYGDDPAILKALEVKKRAPEQWRETIKEKIKTVYTARQWVELKTEERKKIQIDGLKLKAIALIFETQRDPIYDYISFLELGRQIYGDDPVIMAAIEAKKRTPEQWREIIKGIYTTEQWIQLKNEERWEIKIDGLKLNAIARIFEIQGDPNSDNIVHLKLGRQIYGGDPVILKALEVEERTPEQWREAIKKQYTAETWVGLKTKEREKVAIDDRKLHAIAGIFEVNGDPRSNRAVYLKLGRQIYGDDPVIIAAAQLVEDEETSQRPKRPWHETIKKTHTPEQWREIIKRTFTPQQWVILKNRERLKVKIEDLGLAAIARIFGIQGDPNFNRDVHLDLGRQIYGDDPAILKAFEIKGRAPEEWREIIKKTFTPQQWTTIKHRQRKKMRIDGIGLQAIARIFGIQGDPTNDVNIYKELGKVIYGNDLIS